MHNFPWRIQNAQYVIFDAKIHFRILPRNFIKIASAKSKVHSIDANYRSSQNQGCGTLQLTSNLKQKNESILCTQQYNMERATTNPPSCNACQYLTSNRFGLILFAMCCCLLDISLEGCAFFFVCEIVCLQLLPTMVPIDDDFSCFPFRTSRRFTISSSWNWLDMYDGKSNTFTWIL